MQAPRVFISYSHADSEFANKLAADLHATGIDVWIDKWKINIGESIVGRINDGIHKSDFLIVVLSNQSVSSRWVLEELNAATVRNVELEKGAFILPVLIEDCPIPELLRHRKYADFRADASSAFRALVAALKQQSLAPFAPLTEIPVSVPDLIQMIRHLPVSERYRYKPEEVHGTLPLWSILLNQHRIIYLGGEIDDTIGNDIVGQLLILSQRDKDKEIHMYIDSPGGSVAASFAIFDTMEFARVPIATYALANTGGMGTMLLASGAKGRRYALEGLTLEIQVSSAARLREGTVVNDQLSREVERTNRVILEIMTSHTKIEPDDLINRFQQGSRLTAQQAIEYGIIDSIVPTIADLWDKAALSSGR